MTAVENSRKMTGLWWRSLVAMLLSLGTLTALLFCFATGLEYLDGETLARAINLGMGSVGFGLIVSIFALLGWLIFVLPFTWFASGRAWLSHSKYGEIRWAVLGVLSFNAIFLALLQSWGALTYSWIPAIIGAVAGAYFRWLTRGASKAVEVTREP